jgi:hypothetical protein
MTDEFLIRLYVNERLSTVDISNVHGGSKSTIRRRLIKLGVLRTQKEAFQLALPKIAAKLKGRKRTFTESWRQNMKSAAVKRWEGKAKGISLKPNGYYEITIGKNKGRMLHSVIMEIHIGRRLKEDEVVHHKNEIKTDNRIENLEVMTLSEHCSLHAKANYHKRKINKKGQFI